MKKSFILPLLFMATALSFCTSSKPTTTTNTTKTIVTVTYLDDIKPIVTANCSPCHMPPEGSKKPLNTYDSVKSNINDIITRIQLNPGDHGFMPARHPKLPDVTIQAFLKWRDEGMTEK